MLKGIVSGSPVDIKRIAMKGKQLWDKGVPIYTYAGDYKKYNANNAIRLQAGTYTVSSDGALPQIQAFQSDLSQYTTITDAIQMEDNKYVVGWGGYALLPSSNARGASTFTLLSDCVLTLCVNPSYNGTYIMLNEGSSPLPYEPYGMQPGWEVRDQQGTILWGADKTLTGTDSISFKGYALPLKSYEIEANMEQAATQAYTIEGTSSIDYQSDGTAIALQIVGNETQTGTPTPTVPIQPEECGERTGNLCPTTPYKTDYYINENGQEQQYTNFAIWSVTVSPGEYTASLGISASGTRVRIHGYANGTWQLQIIARDINEMPIAFAVPSGIDEIRISISKYPGQYLMLNLGSTAADYEPYGYKIPFSNGNTTYNVYLSEPLRKIGDYGDSVASDGTVVRRIKKVALTGTESSWSGADTPYWQMFLDDTAVYNGGKFCTHFSDVRFQSTGERVRFYVDKTIFDTVTAFKTYLQQQYSAGHPVEVWYVLATPTTEQTTFPTITPTQGANTLSVSTTLAPSKTRLTATSGVWPKNPIEPEEFGERTRQLFDASSATGGWGVDDSTGNLFRSDALSASDYIDVVGMEYIRASYNTSGVQNQYGAFYDTSKQFISGFSGYSNAIAVPSTAAFMRITARTEYIGEFMVVSGSSPLPYEPYGKYKIPITNSGQTYNIFLNEPLMKIGTYADKVRSDGVVERKIKKLVLTGEESITKGAFPPSTNCYQFGFTRPADMDTEVGKTLNSHFKIGSVTNGSYIGSMYNMFPEKSVLPEEATAADFQAYLASEYSAGHPVEVWYVLNTPTTESITAPEIATTQGTNTLAIGTTLTPSKTTVTGHIKELT